MHIRGRVCLGSCSLSVSYLFASEDSSLRQLGGSLWIPPFDRQGNGGRELDNFLAHEKQTTSGARAASICSQVPLVCLHWSTLLPGGHLYLWGSKYSDRSRQGRSALGSTVFIVAPTAGVLCTLWSELEHADWLGGLQILSGIPWQIPARILYSPGKTLDDSAKI